MALFDANSWEQDYADIAGLVDTSYNQPITPVTITQDIATQSAARDNSGTGDVWGAWFRQLGTAAVVSNLKHSQVQAPPNPGYSQALPQQRPVNQGHLLLIGAAVVAVLVLNK